VVPVRRYAGHRHHWSSRSPLRQDLPRPFHLQPGLGLRPLGPLGAPSLGVVVLADAGLVVVVQLAVAVGRAHAGAAHPAAAAQGPGRPRRRVDVAVRRLADAERGAVGPGLSHGLHFHVEARLLGAGDVEGGVAVGLVTLDAGAGAALLADVAGELPAGGRNVLDAVDRLQEHRVGEADLRGSGRTLHSELSGRQRRGVLHHFMKRHEEHSTCSQFTNYIFFFNIYKINIYKYYKCIIYILYVYIYTYYKCILYIYINIIHL